MSSVFNRIDRRWLGKVEYLSIVISIICSVASIISRYNFLSILTPICLLLYIQLTVSKHRRSDELNRQQQDRLEQIEQSVYAYNDIIVEVQTLFSNINTSDDGLSVQQRLSIIEAFLKPYKLESQQLNLQQLLNGLEANIKRTERQFHQERITNFQEQITQLEQSFQQLKDTPEHTQISELPEIVQAIAGQVNSLNLQVAVLSTAQVEASDWQLQIEEKNQKLERQFNNLPFIEFLNRVAQLEELTEQLKSSSIESKQSSKFLKEEIELFAQQVQSLNNQIIAISNTLPANSDRQTSSELQASHQKNIEMTQRLAKEVSSLRKQTQAMLSSLSARITQVRIEVENKQRHSEKSSDKASANSTDNLDTWAVEIGDRLKQK